MRGNRLVAVCTAVCLMFSIPAQVFAEGEAEDSVSIEAEEPETLEAEEPETLEAEEPEIVLDTGTSSNAIEMDGTIPDNVYLETTELSGMTKEEALQAAEKRMHEITGYNIVLSMDDQSVGVSAEELGVTGDFEQTVEQALQFGKTGNVIRRYKMNQYLEESPLQLDLKYQVDEEQLRSVLETYCVPLNREAQDYGLTRENGSFQIIPGQRGVSLKMEESIEELRQYLTEEWKDGVGKLDLEVEITEPKGSWEELSRVQNVLGQGSTDFSSSSAARSKNIKNATEKLNGIVLYPGDVLSVSDNITPFTEENGYYLAGSYANGTVVESFGGGICQVSTTLYLAALRAELEIVERYNHSMSVSYVKLSMDAAISEGAKDFKIKNNLENPIYIEAYAYSGTLAFTIYGEEYRPEGRTVTYESETVETYEATTELIADTESAFGSVERVQGSHTGYSAKLWKVINENGVETREEVNTSYYQMSPAKYKIGVHTSNMEASSAMYSAIASNDLNEVYVVLNQYGAG